MIEVLRRETPWIGLMVAASAVVGCGLYISPMLSLAVVPLPVIFAALVARPTLSLPLLLVATLISDGFQLGLNLGVPLTIAKLSMVLVMGAWFTHCFLFRRWPLEPHRVWGPLIATTTVLVVGLVHAPAIGRTGLDLIIGFSSLAVLIVVVEALADVRHLWSALRLMAWGYVGVVALSIVFGGQIGQDFGISRSTGFGVNPNEWSAMVLLGLGPAVAILDSDEGVAGRVGAMLALLVAAVSIFETVSRSGILVYMLQLPIVTAILWRRRVVLATAVVVLIALVPIVVDFDVVWMRFDSFFDSSELELDGSVRDRSLAQRFAIQSFLSSPILGVGTGGFLAEVEVLSGGQVVKGTHNTYLQILSENGIVGAVIFGWAGFAFARSLWVAWSRQRSPHFRRLVLGFVASFVSFLLMLATLNGLTLTMGFFFLALILVIERVSYMEPAQLGELGLGS